MNYETLPAILTTDEAAAALRKQPQTLRRWACEGSGPIRPVKIGGRLAWKREDLAALIGGNEGAESRKGAA